MKRGRPSNEEKIINKHNGNDKCVNVSISISLKLLNNIEDKIKGSNRSEKFVTCLTAGYEQLVRT